MSEFKKTKLIKLIDVSADEYICGLKTAAEILKSGGLLALPTETVYGLGANALNENSVKNIFIAKGRPNDNPLIVHLANKEDIKNYVKHITPLAKKAIDAFMPGPFTVVLPKNDIIPLITTGGLDSVAIRIPDNKIFQDIIALAKVPIAAPSANISGKPSPTRFSHVVHDLFGKVDGIVEGGNSEIGVESTVVSFLNEKAVLLRPGGISLEQLVKVLGKDNVIVSESVLDKVGSEKTISPGMKYKHYSPDVKIIIVKGEDKNVNKYILNQKDIYKKNSIGVLCFLEDFKKFPEFTCYSLGSISNEISQSSALFNSLRQIDADNKKTEIVFAKAPEKSGIGLALYNRLLRAASFNVIDADKKPIILCITGGTGTGKSTVSKLFCEKGFYHIDADLIAKNVMENNIFIKAMLEKEFNCLYPNKTINRKLLSKIVFNDENKLKKLNEISHKFILENIQNIIEEKANAYKGFIIDAAAIIESGFYKNCDKLIAVTADKNIRIERLIKRNNLTLKEAEERINGQKEDSFYEKYADFTIKNNGNKKELINDINKILIFLEHL